MPRIHPADRAVTPVVVRDLDQGFPFFYLFLLIPTVAASRRHQELSFFNSCYSSRTDLLSRIWEEFNPITVMISSDPRSRLRIRLLVQRSHLTLVLSWKKIQPVEMYQIDSVEISSLGSSFLQFLYHSPLALSTNQSILRTN